MRDLLYIGGGIVAGWTIAKMLLGDGSIRPNASKPKGAGGTGSPTLEELIDALPSFDPDDPRSLDPIQPIKALAPDFVEDVTLWSTASPSLFLLLLDDQPMGVIKKEKDKYSAYFPAYGDVQAKLIEKTTRKNAIGAIYTAPALIAHMRRRRGHIERGQDIADALGIPLSFVTLVGEALATAGFTFGVSGEVRVEPTLRKDKVIIPGMPTLSGDPALRERQRKERAIAKRRKRRGRKTKLEHKRRQVVGSKADVAKLRKSEALTKEEKKELPKAKLVRRYAFGLFGPGNILGMYGLEEGQKKFERLRRQMALEKKQAEEAAKEKEPTVSGETTVDKGRPYYESPEDTIRKLLLSPEEIPSAAYFEDKRLQGLDWLSRQRDQQYLARKVDEAMKRVELLREALEAATERRDAARASGDATRELQAVAQQVEIRSNLDEMLERLERAQKALHDEK